MVVPLRNWLFRGSGCTAHHPQDKKGAWYATRVLLPHYSKAIHEILRS
jgi:hypothetical protein